MRETKKAKKSETTATGKWIEPGVPHSGWTWVQTIDYGKPSKTCEMCEVRKIRFAHVMTHPTFKGKLEVGCVCSGHMEKGYAAAKKRENDLKNYERRMRRFPYLKGWMTSQRGNPHITIEGHHVVVYPTRIGWGTRLTLPSGATVGSVGSLSREEAMIASYKAYVKNVTGGAIQL